MTFNDIEEIKGAGFTGFKKMNELFIDNSIVPKARGVYFILNIDNKSPKFLKVGTGGYFNGKDPNVSLSKLKENWIENAIVVYIGKAGGEGIKATLRSRLRLYFRFGQGHNAAHQGGKLIWQLKDSKDLVVCWKVLPTIEPRIYEANLIQEFRSKFSNRRPFANLSD